mmetsp:Transcript_28061/g.78484  ORF Transcript_28061/g.78484 Transcript_28061/m.78484 type:complete len:220 (+) Transcript_28061:202-861(+)
MAAFVVRCMLGLAVCLASVAAQTEFGGYGYQGEGSLVTLFPGEDDAESNLPFEITVHLVYYATVVYTHVPCDIFDRIDLMANATTMEGDKAVAFMVHTVECRGAIMYRWKEVRHEYPLVSEHLLSAGAKLGWSSPSHTDGYLWIGSGDPVMSSTDVDMGWNGWASFSTLNITGLPDPVVPSPPPSAAPFSLVPSPAHRITAVLPSFVVFVLFTAHLSFS